MTLLRLAARSLVLIGALLAAGCGAPERPAAVAKGAAQAPPGQVTPASAEPAQKARPASDSSASDSSDWSRVVFVTPDGEHPVDVELALTPAQRSQGLMHREELPVGKGMLFVFDQERVQSFWMKNTLIPLDMVFVKGTKEGRDLEVVGVVREAEPRTLTPRTVGKPSRFVVEVIGGWTEVKGIEAGTRVRFE